MKADFVLFQNILEEEFYDEKVGILLENKYLVCLCCLGEFEEDYRIVKKNSQFLKCRRIFKVCSRKQIQRIILKLKRFPEVLTMNNEFAELVSCIIIMHDMRKKTIN